MGMKGLGTLWAALVTSIIVNVNSYDTPTPLVELLNPQGFRISIPDSTGVELFAFHGNINKEMIGNEAGQYSVDIIQKRDGRWTYENPTAPLNPGDTLYFWTHVRVYGRGYEKFFQQFQVPDNYPRASDDHPDIDVRSRKEPEEVHIFSQ